MFTCIYKCCVISFYKDLNKADFLDKLVSNIFLFFGRFYEQLKGLP